MWLKRRGYTGAPRAKDGLEESRGLHQLVNASIFQYFSGSSRGVGSEDVELEAGLVV